MPDLRLVRNAGIHVGHHHVCLCVCSSRPLADSEKLPVRSHRAAEALKSPVEDAEAENAGPQESKKKSSKDKKEKKKDKDRKVDAGNLITSTDLLHLVSLTDGFLFFVEEQRREEEEKTQT